MTLFPAVFRFLLLIALAAGTARAAWEERTLHGRGYVSLESIKEYYDFSSYTRSGKSLTLENKKVRMKMSANSHECVMNGVKFVFSYPVESSGSEYWLSKIDLIKLVHPVLRPNIIETAGNFRTVIIDPGHGGSDPGATNSLGTEARYNLAVAKLLKAHLEQAKYRVIMTREDNRYLSLQQRVDIANRVRENAIFISIHHNSARSSAARGIETFTLSPVGVSHYGRGLKPADFQAKTGNQQDSANVALATAVHGMLLTSLKDEKTKKAYTLDRGIKRARFSVLTGVRHPSILVECGFMTHSYEARLINDPGYQRTVAKAIAIAVHKYRTAVGGSKVGANNQPPQRGRRQAN